MIIENYLHFNINNFKKIEKNISSKEINYKLLNTWITNKLFPQFKKKAGFDNSKYCKMQIQNINGKNFFINKDSYNYLDVDIPTYSAIIFTNTTLFKIGSNYKSIKQITCNKGDCILFKSDIPYCFFGETKVLHIYDIFPNKDLYNSYFENILCLKVQSHSIIEYLFEKLGLCYYNNLHYRYTWIHFLHYTCSINDIHYKISLTDINPKQKKNKIICYQKNNNKNLTECSKNEKSDLLINVDKINYALQDNYYLYYFIKIMIFITIIIVILIFLKDNELDSFFKNPLQHNNIVLENHNNLSENIVINENFMNEIMRETIIIKIGDNVISFPNIDTMIHK